MKISSIKLFSKINQNLNNINSGFYSGVNFSNSLNKDIFQKSTSTAFCGSCSADISNKSNSKNKYIFDFPSEFIEFLDASNNWKDGIPADAVFDITFDGIIDACLHYTLCKKYTNDEERNKFKDAILRTIQSSGIKNVRQLHDLMREYARASRSANFPNFPHDFLSIYLNINEKEDIFNYSDILPFLLNDTIKDSSAFGFNEVIKYLKSIGINNDKTSLTDRLGFLKEYHNDFETPKDKYLAVMQTMSIHDDTVRQLQGIIDKHGMSISAEFLHNAYIRELETSYINNDGEKISAIDKFLPDLIALDKLSGNSRKYANENYSNLGSLDSKIELISMLKRCNLSIEQYMKLCQLDTVSNVDKTSLLVHYDSFVKAISKTLNVDIDDARELYEKFGDCMISLYYSGECNPKYIVMFLNFIKRYKIQNPDDFIDKYKAYTQVNSNNAKNNKRNRKQKGKIDGARLLEFIQLQEFDRFDDIGKASKSKKISQYKLLQQEKEEFDLIKDAISDYISSSDNDFFVGKTPLEIFKEYRNELNVPPEAVKSALDGVVNPKFKDSPEYYKNQKVIQRFSQYFDTKDKQLKFIRNSEIEFTESENPYTDFCVSLLDIAKKSLSDEDWLKFSDFLISNKFLLKLKYSQKDMDEILSLAEQCGGIFSLIMSERITSPQDVFDLIDEFKDNKDGIENVVNYYSNMPDEITTKDSITGIRNLERKLRQYGFNVHIDNKNILCVPYPVLNDIGMSDKEFANLLNNLHSAANIGYPSNYTVFYKDAFNKPKHNYSATYIIKEILSQVQKFDSIHNAKYENIQRAFGLNEIIGEYENAEDRNDAEYIERIEEKIPDEFYKFVNSDEYLKIESSQKNEKIPELSLHAKMRLIDRFGLVGVDFENGIDYEKVAANIKDVLSVIYMVNPTVLLEDCSGEVCKIASTHKCDNYNIRVVFDDAGKMVTAINLKKSNS
ncbi:MAG: hypothetical protein IKR34_08160 [Candidatus Gastranaerophilales bacterium]|nr:hypothetical protein [Candidatus Gastranaerophilales bacterium]